MSIKISSTSSNNSSGELHSNEHFFSSLVSNLNLNSIVANSSRRRTNAGDNEPFSALTASSSAVAAAAAASGAQSTTNLNFNAQSTHSITHAAQSRGEVEPFLYNKSKFKTIKIFVASNKNEFSNELECLHREVLPELQQYFMQYGYDFSFVDFNLNLEFDPFLDPNLFDCMLNELDDCYRVSDGCFFLALLGNKHGTAPLPSELNPNQIEIIRSLSSNQEFEFLKSWYPFDDMTKLYKLKPFVSSFKNIYNIQTDNIESRKVEMRALKDTYERLYEIIQQLANNEQKNFSNKNTGGGGSGSANGSLNSTRSKKAAGSSSGGNSGGVSDRIGFSGLELLTQAALKYSSNDCFIFSRVLENLDASKKSAEKYVDLASSIRIDKQKEEKQAKFRESAAIQKLLGEENRCEVKLKWKDSFDSEAASKSGLDNFGDGSISMIRKSSSPPTTLKQAVAIATSATTSAEQQPQQQLAVMSQPEISITTEAVNDRQSGAELTNGGTGNSVTNPTKFFDKFDSEYKTYLEQFISMLVDKLKHLINKSVRAFDAACDCRFNWHEIALLQEITRHMYRFERTSSFSLSPLDSEDYVERFKRLVSCGARSDHWPVFIYGLPCTGKSFLLNRFVSAALSLYPDSYSLVRYFELTGQCSTFEGLLFSLCEQLSMIDHAKTPAPAVLAPQDQPQSLAQPQTQQTSIYQLLKAKDVAQLVDYFYKQCKQLSEKQPVFVFIEGLHDMNAERSMLSKTSVSNNQIAWLFANKLPPNVHIVASIRRQSMTSVRTGFEAMNELGTSGASTITKRPSTTSTTPSPLASTYIPLFLYYLTENVLNESSALPSSTPAMLTVSNSNPNMSTASSSSSSSQLADNCVFEMPVSVKKLDTSELGAILRQQLGGDSDLGVMATPLCDEYLRSTLQGLLNTNSGMNSTNPPSSPLTTVQIDTSSVVGGGAAVNGFSSGPNTNYYYVNFILRDLVMSGRFILPSITASNDSFPRDLESYFRLRIDAIEKKFNPKMLSILFNYISASHNGVTEMELIDLLSCNNELFTEFYTDSNLPSILKFPVSYWIMLKFQLGYFLSQRYVDCKITYHWTNDTIKRLMKQRYLNKVEQIRQCHKDLANYFLESFIETKPLVDMSRNLHLRDEDGRRYIAQQPLVYSETKYNYRRMSELWFHFMNSGDIQRLKEHALFNYEHLLAKCHGMSVQVLLNDIDAVLRRILDVDILLMSSLLRKSILALVQDPLRLASEILARMRPLEEEYGEHVTSLVNQVLTWCDQHDAPVLVPYTTWLDTPESLLVTKIEHAEGILKLAVTSFNQHVFFSNSKNEICMYHIPSKKMVRRFSGHADVINFLLISHNNRYLISGSSDKLIKVWNLGNGEMENTFNNHKSAILCGILTYSDEFLITGTYDRLINIIRVETGDIVLSEEKHFDSVTALAISLDDSILVSASLDKSVKRWSFPEMELVDTISTIYSPITSMTLTFDNTFLIIGCENHSVQVKSLITGADIHEITTQSGPAVNAMCASADCERIFIGCADSKLYLYDIKTRELIAVLVEQEAPINDLRLSADASFLFSSSGNSLYVLNMKKKKFNNNKSSSSPTKPNTPDPQNLPTRLVKAIAMSKDGEMAITGDCYGQVSLWNLVRGELIEIIIEDPLSSPPPIDPQAQAQANNLTVSTAAGTMNTVEQQNGPQIAQPATSRHYHLANAAASLVPVNHVALFNSHLFSLIAFNDSTVSVYDNEIGDVVAVFDEHQTPVKYLHIMEESRRVFTSDGINSCKIWVPHSGQLLETITVACSLIGLSPDSKYVVSGPGDNNAKIWLLSDAQVIRNINHKDRITTLSFTPDSVYAITGSEDCSCKIWELATGKLIQVLIEHEAAITTIAAPLNNSMVISGGRDKLVLVWNFRDGSVLHKLVAHVDVIVRVAITHDASTVVSGSRDGLVCVWSAHHGNLLSSLFLQHTLADLVVAYDASHIVARLEESELMPIIGLTRKWPKELAIARTMSSSSLRSFEHFNKGIVKRLNRYQMILPIKPKPFMIKNKSTHFSTFFTEDSKLKELIRSRKESEPNALNIAQNENSISTPQHSFSRSNAGGGLLAGDKRSKRSKVKKTGADGNSTSSGMAANRAGKQRKTKICCLL